MAVDDQAYTPHVNKTRVMRDKTQQVAYSHRRGGGDEGDSRLYELFQEHKLICVEVTTAEGQDFTSTLKELEKRALVPRLRPP